MDGNRKLISNDAAALISQLSANLTAEDIGRFFPNKSVDEVRALLDAAHKYLLSPEAAVSSCHNSAISDTETSKIEALFLYTDGAARGNPGPAGKK